MSLAIRGDTPEEVLLTPALEEFRSKNNDVDIEVNVEWAEELKASPGEPMFDSGAVWTSFRAGAELVFDFCSPEIGINPYKRVRTDASFRAIQLILSRKALQGFRPVFPLEYPADELLITNYLASDMGVEVHGCGIVDAETGGHLFLGHSGAGKSTTTRIWKSLRDVEILSDDRIILRLHDDELWMYGTPWHGEAAFASAGKAKISKFFVLQHGERNQFVPLSRSRAVGELFARSFPPFHSASGLTKTLKFLHGVVSLVPSYEFHFVPNVSAIEAILAFGA